MTSTIFRNARLVGRSEKPRTVTVIDGVIEGISTERAPDGDRVIDLHGRYLGPGLWDNHVHFSQWALVRQRLDISLATSARHAASLIAESLKNHAPLVGQPFVAFGFRDGLWPDTPHFSILDAVAPWVAVVLISADLHCVWLNTTGLRHFGLGSHPTGLLREQAAFDITLALSTVSPDVLDGWVREAAVAAAIRGVVGIVDMEMAPTLDDWPRRIAAGIDQLRVRCAVYTPQLERSVSRGLRSDDVLPETDGLVTMGPFKIITDGSLNTRTAYCHDAYAGLEQEATGHGVSTVPFGELVTLLRRASSNGITPSIHAIGDAANQLALDAFEAAGCGGVIEHAQLIAETDFGRFARLGVSASVQPEHAMDDRDVADLYWAGRTDRAFALASLTKAGASLRFGSDAPVAPLDPWISMAAAVSRSRDNRPPWHPEQRSDLPIAYAASTDGRTTVSVGDVADLVVTGYDPLACSDTQLRSMEVAATMIAGRFTHFELH